MLDLRECRRLTLIPCYPREDHELIVEGLLRFVDSSARLRWLIDTAVRHMKRWEGIAELRALYATRYAPADGEAAGDCSIPGFTPADSEQAYIAAEARETERKLEAWKREARRLPASEREANRKLPEDSKHALAIIRLKSVN